MQKNRLSISREQRLFLLRQLVSTRSGLETELGFQGISVEAKRAIAGELVLVEDLIRKLVRMSDFVEGVNY